MVKVAIAGATSKIGRLIVDAIAKDQKYDVIAISRRPTDLFSHLPNVEYYSVDYADPASLDAALAGVHTVINTFWDFDEKAFIAASLALLDAAVRAGAKRFAPSELAPHGLPEDPVEMYRCKAVVSQAVRKSGLEYTLFETGLFMNLLAAGAPNSSDTRPLIFDVENCTARIPGDGSAYMVYIRREDIARFVAESLDLEKWPEISRMAGDRKTLNEVLKIAESVRGRKFDVTYVSLADLQSQVVPSPPSPVVNVLPQMLMGIAQSDRWGRADANLNGLCPVVDPMGIEEFLRTWWGKQ